MQAAMQPAKHRATATHQLVCFCSTCWCSAASGSLHMTSQGAGQSRAASPSSEEEEDDDPVGTFLSRLVEAAVRKSKARWARFDRVS